MNGMPKPAVWPWYVGFCVAMAVLAVFVAGLGLFFLIAPTAWMNMPKHEAVVLGVVYLAGGAVLFLPYAVAPFLPCRPWHWVYGLVLICLSMTSCCCLPAAIPLLVFWIKPETKAWFQG